MQTSKKKTFQLLTGIFAVLIGIGLDQLTKQLAVLHLKEKEIGRASCRERVSA